MTPTHHYLGRDEHGIDHVPHEDEAACRPLFGIDQPISIRVTIATLSVPVTCLECAARFPLKVVTSGRR